MRDGRPLSVDSITIPIVIHVIHNGGPENISDSQIFSQIEVLNEDFRKKPGTRGYGKGVDTKIQFCLAKRDPQGRATTGIVRIRSSLTNHQQSQRGLLSKLSFWDPARYLNIYMVKSIGGSALGYSSFPGGPRDADGVVIEHTAFGRIGTVKPPNNLGRTLTHEISHWFGLYHTFNGGCGSDTCTDGDNVCDTPPVASPNYGCPKEINSCHNDLPDLPDQVENYADYTVDSCKSMFTRGQQERMVSTLAALREFIWSDANLAAAGCSLPDTQTWRPVIADFVSLEDTICTGTNIQFFSRAQNNASKWKWLFPGGMPSESSDENPVVAYPAIGSYDVGLTVSNDSSSDTLYLYDYITVIEPTPGRNLQLVEGFEQPAFPPNGITIDNPDSGITWHRTTLAAKEGSASVVINNLINTNYGQSDALILPPFDLSAFGKPIVLSFKWAYARSNPTYSDELILELSTDCGTTFTNLFKRSGSTLATGPTQDSPFVPLASQWKSISLNLDSFASATHAIIRFVNVTDGGNNLYIDSIALGNAVLQTVADEADNGSGLMTVFSTGNDLHIRSPFPLNPARIDLINVSGIRSPLRAFYQNSDSIIVTIAGQPPGVYFLELIYSSTTLRKKIIIAQ